MTTGNGNKGKFRILIVRFLGRVISSIESSLQVVYDGIVAPLLGYEGMEKLIELAYKGYGPYTETAYNKSGFFRWEQEAIGDFPMGSKRFMVLAAGGGRETIALLRRGATVDAWECNEELRNYGNLLLEAEGFSARIQPMEPSRFPSIPQTRKYDFCVVGWSAYCHILRREDRIALLSSIGSVTNGSVLISFVGKKHVRKLKRTLRSIMFRFPGATKGISDDLVASPGTISVGFDESDIAAEAGAAGLSVKTYNNRFAEYPYALLVSQE